MKLIVKRGERDLGEFDIEPTAHLEDLQKKFCEKSILNDICFLLTLQIDGIHLNAAGLQSQAKKKEDVCLHWNMTSHCRLSS